MPTKRILPIVLAAALALSGCGHLQTAVESPDARVTLSESYVATPTGLVERAEAEPGTYAQNQVIEPGTYTRADLEAFAPGPLPASAEVEPGQSPSFLENILTAVGGVASTIPGGQPIGVLLVGAAGMAKIWRDQRRIKDTERVAKTLASARDAALDTVATLPDREQARRIEEEINQHTEHFAKRLGKTRDLLDAIIVETSTPTKRAIAQTQNG